jgi:hypothetical protein
MNQTLFAVPVIPALHIHSGEVSAKNQIIETSVDASPFYNETGFYVPSAIFYYEDRVRVTLAIKSQYTAYFVLTKGLLEFHRSKDFLFTYNREEKTIDVGVRIHDVDRLCEFLANTSVWVDQEIKFKSVLNDILKFEKAYKKKMNAIYSRQREAVAL